MSSGHCSLSLLIFTKSIYWNYKTQVVQYNYNEHVKINTRWLTAFSHSPGVKTRVIVVLYISAADLHGTCCKS